MFLVDEEPGGRFSPCHGRKFRCLRRQARAHEPPAQWDGGRNHSWSSPSIAAGARAAGDTGITCSIVARLSFRKSTSVRARVASPPTIADNGNMRSGKATGMTQRPAARFGPAGRSDVDDVAIEEPLEIRVAGDPLAITMRTPGDDRELTLGFLYAEGVIASIEDVGSVAHCGRA